MAVSSTYSAASASSVVIHGSKFDHVTGANLTTVGTVSTGNDAGGDFIEATSQPGNYLSTAALQRITKTSGGTWVVRFKTTATGVVSLGGMLDTGTAYIENVVLNLVDVAGTNTAGCIGIYIRSSTGAVIRLARTSTALALNDGALHTVALEWTKTTNTFQIYVDGSSVAVTYSDANGGDPSSITSGVADFGHFLLARNVRGTADQHAVAKLYTFGRLRDSGFNLATLSSDSSVLIASGSTDATGTGSVAGVTLTAVTGTASGSGDAVGTGAVVAVSLTPPTGSAAGTSAGATLTIGPLKNNTGTVLASESGITVHIYQTSGALVVSKTAQTTNGSGILTVSDAALTASTVYRFIIVMSSGAEGMDKLVAA